MILNNIKSNRAFTLVEIMVTLFIISIVFAIAVQGYLKSHITARRTICVTNLKEIDSAIDQWVLENHVAIGTSISGYEDEVYDDYVKGASRPRCPTGGKYTFGIVGTRPQISCSLKSEGHEF